MQNLKRDKKIIFLSPTWCSKNFLFLILCFLIKYNICFDGHLPSSSSQEFM